MRSNSLLAILFAASLVNSPLPAIAIPVDDTSDGLIQRITGAKNRGPEVKAYYLLLVAENFIHGKNRADVEKQCSYLTKEFTWFPRSWEETLAPFIERSANSSSHVPRLNHTKVEEVAKGSISTETRLLASIALKEAQAQLENSTDVFAKLNMVYIASRLYTRLGNKGEAAKCEQIIDAAFQECEKQSNLSPTKVNAVISIFDAEAFACIPVPVKTRKTLEIPNIPSYTDSDYSASEKLKLRAIAMADRLPKTEHVRRKAHRDLALWYKLLGKNELAEMQKHILFELVGSADDSLLYLQIGSCGSLVWWEIKPVTRCFACGMG